MLDHTRLEAFVFSIFAQFLTSPLETDRQQEQDKDQSQSLELSIVV